MNDRTAVIDMRTPATAPLPVLGRPASHARRAPSGRRTDYLRLVELSTKGAGWGTLAVLLVRWATTLPVV